MRKKNTAAATIRIRACMIAAIAALTLLAGVRSGLGAEELGILQNFKQGDILPPIELQTIKDPVFQTFTPGKGKPAVIMFFSVRPDFRKQRSLALLSALSDLANQYKSRLDTIAVFSDSEESALVRKYMENSTLNLLVLHDSQKRAYNTYGVFMMPLVVLSDKEGRLHEVIPYTYNIRDIMEANIKYLLGELDRDKLAGALAPRKNIEMSADEKEYIRRVNYGRVMHSKQMYGQAVREFSNAVKLKPESIEAYIGLGWAQLKTQKYDDAEASFKKALKINPQSDEAIGGLGLAYYGRREIAAALIELEKAIIATDPHLEVIITLADIYELKGHYDKANRLNKLAVSILMTLYEQRWK